MAVKTSKDISSNIKRLQGILERQREALKALSLSDPDFATTKSAIQKTVSQIKSNESELAKAITKEKSAKAKISLAEAKDNLAYAEASGDAEEIRKAKSALNVADRDVKGKDSDKDGIPDTIDAEPNTPKEPLTPEPKPEPKPKPKPKPGEEAKGETPLTDAQQRAEALGVAAGQDFALPETIFNNVDSLKRILERYVKEDWTPDKLRKAIRDDVWFRKNSGEIKARYVQYYNFRDLQASGQAQGTTDYEMQIDKIEAKLKKRAVEIGSAAASDPAAIRKAAENLYITNRSEDDAFVDSFLAASIRPVAGMIGGKGTQGYSGQALKNYQELLTTARSNGLKISDIVPGGSNTQQVLQGIASGKLDINRIVQDTRKLAAQGQPQYVRDLLSQGYNLDQVFAPYRQTMAAVLEIDDPNSIDLNDPLLRSAINDKGDMNIYEFKKTLRRDPRWQYTEQARQDVSSATLNILRDFGFQG